MSRRRAIDIYKDGEVMKCVEKKTPPNARRRIGGVYREDDRSFRLTIGTDDDDHNDVLRPKKFTGR